MIFCWERAVFVEGKAVGKGSFTAAMTKPKDPRKTPKAVLFPRSSAALKKWNDRAVAAMKEVAPSNPWVGAAAITVIHYVKRPLKHYVSKNVNKGLIMNAPHLPIEDGVDGDKVLRAICDALQNAGWIMNDRCFVIKHIERRYATDANPEGLKITVEGIVCTPEEAEQFQGKGFDLQLNQDDGAWRDLSKMKEEDERKIFRDGVENAINEAIRDSVKAQRQDRLDLKFDAERQDA